MTFAEWRSRDITAQAERHYATIKNQPSQVSERPIFGTKGIQPWTKSLWTKSNQPDADSQPSI